MASPLEDSVRNVQLGRKLHQHQTVENVGQQQEGREGRMTLQEAYNKGCEKYREEIGSDVPLVVSKTAWNVFAKRCAGRETHPSFAEEAPDYAYYLILDCSLIGER